MPTANKNNESGRVGFLDGFRGWASLVVLFAHLNAFLLDPSLYANGLFFEHLSNLDYASVFFTVLLNFTPEGSLAVQVFFVLSGYALSVSHLNPDRRRLALAVAARYFRLMIPIFVVAVITFAVFKADLFFNDEAGGIAERYSGWISVFFKTPIDFFSVLRFSVYDVFFNYDSNNTLNPPLWTMSYELLGSLIIYAYLLFFRSGDSVWWKTAILFMVVFAALQSYFLCFMAGYLIAEINRRYPAWSNNYWIAKISSISPFAFMLLFVVSYFFRGSPHVIAGSVIAIGLVFFASYSESISRVLSNSISEFFGRISFPLYLIHVVVLSSFSCFLFVLFYRVGLDGDVSILLNMALTVVLCVMISVALIPVEKRSMSYSKWIAKLLVGYLSSLVKSIRYAYQR